VCARGPTGRTRAWLALAVLAASLACGTDEPAAPERSPLRILSLSRDVSALLVELGLAAEVVGADRASLALPELRAAADLGALDGMALSLAVALRPDLALLLSDDPSPPFAAELERRGIRCAVLSPRTANDVLAAVHRLGALLGVETRASALAAKLTRDVAAIATRRDGRTRVRVAWLLRRDPPVVVGGSGLLHELLELAGAENVFHGPPDAPTPEQVEVGLAELRASGADVVLEADELARLPLLDLTSRVSELHARLYPGEAN
jgi:iron complex transport system substrate-binding protein